MTSQPCFHVAFLIAVACSASCVDEELGEIESDLSTTSWSAPLYLGSSDLGSAVATVNGTSVIVRTECCDANYGQKDLAWAKRTATGWTSWVVIPGQTSTELPSLAGFNGFIYMLRMGTHNDVYMARFNPTTSTWSQSWLLPYQSYQMPAIVTFQNKLWILGNTPGTYQMWSATMTTGEVLSQAQLITGKYTSWRASAAVFGSRLYMAHAQLSSGNIIYASFDGTTWTANQFLLVGPNGSAVPAPEPVLATVNGFLHIVYRAYYNATAKWSYFDGCVWSPEVSIGSLTTMFGFSLAQGGRGLLLTTSNSSSSIFVSEFTAPPAPIIPPSCGGANQP